MGKPSSKIEPETATPGATAPLAVAGEDAAPTRLRLRVAGSGFGGGMDNGMGLDVSAVAWRGILAAAVAASWQPRGTRRLWIHGRPITTPDGASATQHGPNGAALIREDLPPDPYPDGYLRRWRRLDREDVAALAAVLGPLVELAGPLGNDATARLVVAVVRGAEGADVDLT